MRESEHLPASLPGPTADGEAGGGSDGSSDGGSDGDAGDGSEEKCGHTWRVERARRRKEIILPTLKRKVRIDKVLLVTSQGVSHTETLLRALYGGSMKQK